tara:strand:- start:109 stop:345 length:237 start_codon:yes stop_codon:yes gene_type:complete
MARVRTTETKKKDTYERQMSAVIGKFLSDLEEMSFLREIHPMEFDKLRRRGIDAAWECYLVGRKKGLQEAVNATTNTA